MLAFLLHDPQVNRSDLGVDVTMNSPPLVWWTVLTALVSDLEERPGLIERIWRDASARCVLQATSRSSVMQHPQCRATSEAWVSETRGFERESWGTSTIRPTFRLEAKGFEHLNATLFIP